MEGSQLPAEVHGPTLGHLLKGAKSAGTSSTSRRRAHQPSLPAKGKSSIPVPRTLVLQSNSASQWRLWEEAGEGVGDLLVS